MEEFLSSGGKVITAIPVEDGDAGHVVYLSGTVTINSETHYLYKDAARNTEGFLSVFRLDTSLLLGVKPKTY